MRKLRFLSLLFITVTTGAYSACYNFDNQQSSNTYSGYTRFDDVIPGTTQSYGATACSSSTTKWYYDTTEKVYRKITSCNTCPPAYNLVDSPALYGSCITDVKVCVECVLSTTVPDRGSPQGTISNPSGVCAKYSTYYLYSSTADAYLTILSCDVCGGGHIITTAYTFANCPFTYRTCETCYPGTRYDPTLQSSSKCVACGRGTYTSTPDTKTCIDCPSATNPPQYINSALTSVASYNNGSIGHDQSIDPTTPNTCFLKAGTYYDEKGTYRTPSCYYNNVERTGVGIDCSIIQPVCTTVVGSGIAPGAPYGTVGQGQACWCGFGEGSYNGSAKWVAGPLMGPSASGSDGTCAANCSVSYCTTVGNGSWNSLGCN